MAWGLVRVPCSAGEWGAWSWCAVGVHPAGATHPLCCHELQGLLDAPCCPQVLQPPHGVAFVAAKSYYFGVGGGTKSFSKLVKEDGIFEVGR